MKKGYIFALSLKLLIIISGVFLIKYNQTMTTINLYNQAEALYERLEAEKDIFDEILYRLYIYDYDNFEYMYENYQFEVKMSESDIEIEILEPEQYSIKITYIDECLCFSEILYK